MIKISFLGAAETVTGSCYLVENGTHRILVDCGLFQGINVYTRNYEQFEFNPAEIDCVILTHAHMDHSGLLPKLVRYGFSGKIYTTPPTTQLSEILLLDAAKIQESNLRADSGHNNSSQTDIIYTTFDSLNTIASFVSVNFDEEIELAKDVKLKFIKAGHILGAASVCLEVAGKKIVFSGDIGRRDEAIIEPYIDMTGARYKADYIVMESLYGGVKHQTRTDAAKEMLDIVTHTLARGGNIVIPSFAVQKTQELLEIFKHAFEQNILNSDIKVVLDSPLAIKATSIYTNNFTYFDPAKYDLRNKELMRNVFNFDNLKTTRTHKQSLKSSIKNKSIFIAGSGMAEGGRIIRHLINHLPHKNNSVIFVGFQAEGTKGREILAGAKAIFLDGKEVEIKAEIRRIEGFSSHADHDDLLYWLSNFDPDSLKKVFLTHADPNRSESFAHAIREKAYNAYIPKWKEVVELE